MPGTRQSRCVLRIGPMPTRRRQPAPPPQGPPELQIEADRALKIINDLLAEGNELMKTIPNSTEGLEQFEAMCKRWSSKAHEHLRRIWDQDNYAETLALAASYGGRTDFRRWELDQESLRRQLQDLEMQLDKIDIASSSPRRKPTQLEGEPLLQSRNVFNIQGNVGALTVADKVRDIKSKVNTVSGLRADDVQRLTQAFADALSRASSIGNEERDDALEQLNAVTEEMARPGTHKRGLLRAAIASLGLLTKGSADLHAIYDQWHGAVQGFLSQQSA
jgi:hypothetical protein